MVAIAYTDFTTPAPPAISPAKTPAPRRSAPAAPAASDPVVDIASRLLSGPLNQMYALLWRVGVLTVSK